MALSSVSYLGDGSNKLFSVTFPYLSKSHVEVLVNGVEDTTFTWVTPASINTTNTPALGAIVVVKRKTPTAPLVDFVDGSTLTEKLLDMSTAQSLYLAEESSDSITQLLQVDIADNKFDGLNKTIKNVADPVNPQDVATKSWSETAVTSSVAQAANSAASALTSKNAAAISETNAASSSASALASKNAAQTSESNANTQAGVATTKASEANTSAGNAATSAAAATTKASEASTSAATATTQAGVATTKASEANTSAGNAATSAAQAAASSATINLPALSSAQKGKSLLVNSTGTGYVFSEGAASFRNRLINGAFDIWQRGASFNSAGVSSYTADRWGFFRGNLVAGGTVSRVTGTQGRYAMRVARDVGDTAVEGIALVQLIESATCYSLAGNSVTVSFRARAGVNFSAANNLLVLNLYTGTGVDQGNITNTGAWTGVVIQSQSFNLTTSYQTFSKTFTVAAGVSEIATNFTFTPVGTAGAADYFEIEQVQLEEGTVGTPFEARPFPLELALCQRYFEKSFPMDTAPAQNAGVNGSITLGQWVGASIQQSTPVTPYKVNKRTSPTVTLFNPSAANTQIRNATTNTDWTSSTVGASANAYGFNVIATSPAGSAVGQAARIHFTADAEL